MKKQLSCRAMGLNCDFTVRGESEDRLVQEMADHLKVAHGIEATEAIRRRARDLIRLEAA